ncbi:hypothetical protein NLU13_1347 [Sarocladium strictum]|uniref:Uncharacterized protein n=1 Tax=Sarocladium strictum TaxID=5046 RepID=A0AA39LC52_SARSR|nr:hypothetical protein NLU13_1347 [Sarocladium strictum]
MAEVATKRLQRTSTNQAVLTSLLDLLHPSGDPATRSLLATMSLLGFPMSDSSTSSPRSSASSSPTSVQYHVGGVEVPYDEDCYLVSAPDRIKPGKKFDIIIGSERKPREEMEQPDLCVIRKRCVLDVLDGPVRVDYTTGSYAFRNLCFAGNVNHPRDSWVVMFELYDDNAFIAHCGVTVELDRTPVPDA